MKPFAGRLGMLLAAAALSAGRGGAAAPEPKLRTTLRGAAAEVRCVVFSPDGKALASSSESETLPHSGEVMVWDLATGKGTVLLERPKSTDWLLAFAPDGRLATAGPDGIRVWDLHSRKEKLTVKGPIPSCLAFSPDGKTLAVGGMRETGKEAVVRTDEVRLWDAESGKRKATLERELLGGVTSMAFSPDGKTLATVTLSFAIEVALWDLSSEKPIKIFRDRKVIGCLAYGPDGRTLATGDEDGTIKLRDAPTGKELGRLAGHAGWVSAVQFSPDGKRLASAGHDGTVRLWDVDTGEERAVLKGHEGKVESVAFSPDGRLLASGGDDRAIKLWDVPPARKGDR